MTKVDRRHFLMSSVALPAALKASALRSQNNKCMDVDGGATGNGAVIQLWTCNGSGAQNWSAQADGSLRNPQSGKCLDVAGNNSADSTPVQLWTCNGAANQKWTLP